jgi:Rrf2 family protein
MGICMKLTTKSEYALLALIFIARLGNSAFIKAEDICNAYGIPKKYLEQLLFSLKRSGLIKAKTGAEGGYRLADAAEKISLADVVRVMDGALAPDLAVSKYFYSSTPLEKEKKLMSVFKEIRDYLADKAENIKIADLI